jgi:hypothetical protein
MAVADLFRLTPAAALAVIADANAAVRQWGHVAARHGIDPIAIKSMAPAFEHRQAEVVHEMVSSG